MTDRQPYAGCTVVITGASMGVGEATAHAFGARGANLVLLARGRERLERVAAELGDPDRIMAAALDVTDFDGFSRLLEQAEQRFGTVDVLVNNAGFHARGLVEAVDPADIGRMVDVNFKAPLIASRLALPYLKKATRPAIINVASLAGRTPVPGSATYSATKFGLRAFSLALGEEVRGSGIRIACVSPGPVDTAFIMDDIVTVPDLTFSQPLSTAGQVADTIVDLVDSDTPDRAMPRLSGYLATLGYLFPRLGRALRPVLERKGRRVKQRLKRERVR